MVELTCENAAKYLGRNCTITALGGGVSNTVLLAECGDDRLVLKQSLGKLRVEEDWFSGRERIFREAAALRMLSGLLPGGAIPKVISEDFDNFILVMSAAPAAARTWKNLLFDGIIRTETAQRIARMLGAMILGSCHSTTFEERFGDQTVFDQLRIDPYYRTAARRNPDLAGRIHKLIETSSNRRVSLVHGDWSPKNFLVDGDNVMAIDFEVIHYGDPSFDAAFLLNHLLLKSCHFAPRRDQFNALAIHFWNTLADSLGAGWEWFEQATLEHLACLLLARIDGKSPAEYIVDPQEKQTIREIARAFIVHPPCSVAAVFSC